MKYRIKIVNKTFYPQYRKFLRWKYFKTEDFKGTEICKTTIYKNICFYTEVECIEFINNSKITYKYL